MGGSGSSAGADGVCGRELSADFYRVVGVLIVVIGHWLVSAVTFRDGRFGNDYPLDVLPWTRWLTLVFQVVPVFFLVGGYASAAAWLRWRAAGGQQSADWVRRRLGAILGPTTAYVLLMLAVVAVLAGIGVERSPLWFGGWAVAMHLWFVPVYLVVVALTPVAMAAHRRWGLMVPAALALVVAGVDVAARGTGTSTIATANYLLCWGAVYQLGICWHSGLLRGYRPVLLAGSAAVVLAALLVSRSYPITMVGAPGATAQNNFPPTVALLTFAAVQAGLLVAAAPAVTRWLRGSRWRRTVAAANRTVMALYLWQMVPVVVVALVGYPTGILPQPEPGAGVWWLFRLVWLVMLALVAVVVLTLLWRVRSVADRALPTITIALPRWGATPVLIAGTAMAVMALAHFSVEGLAPHGRFPTMFALLYGAAIGLLALCPRRARGQTVTPETVP